MKSIFLILALGLALRLWGISFGLPDAVHADEPIVINHALAFGSGDLNPHFFKIPPLVSYLLFFCYGVYFLVGGFHAIGQFQNLFIDNPSSFFLIARVVFGVLMGTATIYLLYRLIKKYFTDELALLSAFFLALAFLHVRDSHFVYADIPLLFMLVACFFPILGILGNDRLKDYLLFGVFAGIAVATKYNGIFIFIPFLVAHFLRRGFKFNLGFFASGLVSILTYSILNPYTWLDAKFFFHELLGQGDSTGFVGWTHHLTYSLAGGIGWTVLLAASVGILLSRDKIRWVVGSFVVSYYVLLCFFSQPYERYVLPIIPFLCFFAADALSRIRLPKFCVWIIAFFLIIPSLTKSVLCDQVLAAEDIRSIAKQDFESRAVLGSKVALDVPQFMPKLNFNVPQLEQKKLNPVSKLQSSRISRLMEQMDHKRYELRFLNDNPNEAGFLFASPSIAYQFKDLKANGIQYVLLAKISNDHPEFLQELEKNSEIIAVYSPYKDKTLKWSLDKRPLTGAPFLFKDLLARERNGHIIEVYRIK